MCFRFVSQNVTDVNVLFVSRASGIIKCSCVQHTDTANNIESGSRRRRRRNKKNKNEFKQKQPNKKRDVHYSHCAGLYGVYRTINYGYEKKKKKRLNKIGNNGRERKGKIPYTINHKRYISARG